MSNSDGKLQNYEQLSSDKRDAMVRRLSYINAAADAALSGGVAERPDLWAIPAAPAATLALPESETPAPIITQAGEAAIDFVQQREDRAKADHDARIADIQQMVADAHRLREEQPGA